MYADIPGFPSLSIITGDDLRPELLLKTKDNCLYSMELTIGFETNLNNNAERKRASVLPPLRNCFAINFAAFPSYQMRDLLKFWSSSTLIFVTH